MSVTDPNVVFAHRISDRADISVLNKLAKYMLDSYQQQGADLFGDRLHADYIQDFKSFYEEEGAIS